MNRASVRGEHLGPAPQRVVNQCGPGQGVDSVIGHVREEVGVHGHELGTAPSAATVEDRSTMVRADWAIMLAPGHRATKTSNVGTTPPSIVALPFCDSVRGGPSLPLGDTVDGARR